MYFGRKPSLWFGCVLVFVSTAMIQGATQISVFQGAMFLNGLHSALFNTHSRLYLIECSPDRYRGLSLVLYLIALMLGTLAILS